MRRKRQVFPFLAVSGVLSGGPDYHREGAAASW